MSEPSEALQSHISDDGLSALISAAVKQECRTLWRAHRKLELLATTVTAPTSGFVVGLAVYLLGGGTLTWTAIGAGTLAAVLGTLFVLFTIYAYYRLIEAPRNVCEQNFRQRRRADVLLQKWIGNGAFHADFLRLYNRGRRLSDDCDEFPQKPLPEAETEIWVKNVEAFLRTRTSEPLNDLYLGMFHEDAKLSKPSGSWGELPQSKLRYKIDCHVYQLHQIMNSLATMRLSGVANQFGPDAFSEST
jgi:hypothetical protein